MTTTAAPPAVPTAPAPPPPAVAPRRRPGLVGPRRGTPAWIVRTALLGLAAVAVGFVVDIVLVSQIQYAASQSRDFATLRDSLANATTPVSQTDPDGHLVPVGTPIALVSIPAIGVHDVVVVEGTSGDALRHGPGHQRSTPFPGQAGLSVLQGRAAAFGGPFGDIGSLRAGDEITVVTGQGTTTFRVTGSRREGDALPAIASGQGWLSLVTATGHPYAPTGVLRVDARLQGDPQDSSVIYARDLPTAEQPLGTAPESLPTTVLALQGLLVAVLLAVWSWSRLGGWRTWIAFGPVVGLAVVLIGNRIVLLLPNLL